MLSEQLPILGRPPSAWYPLLNICTSVMGDLVEHKKSETDHVSQKV